MTISPRISRSTAPPRRGFTMIELVTVIIIVGLIAAIAIPRYASAVVRYRLDAAAYRVAGDLEMAADRAQAQSQNMSMVFNPVADLYVISQIEDPDNPGNVYTVKLDQAPYQVDLTKADFGGSVFFSFSGYGIADSGGTVELQCGGDKRTITLDGNTMEVSVQ